MQNIKIGDNFIIHGYKHNKTVYKQWDEAILLDIKDDYLVFGNEKTKVTEADGRTWRTKEPAIMFFYKNRWFNIKGQCKKDGIYFYCDMASPFVIEDGAIKYIDYDLDLRVFSDGSFKVLDRGEYNYHKTKMNYPKEIDRILKWELTELINIAKSKTGPFTPGLVEEYEREYNRLKINLQK